MNLPALNQQPYESMEVITPTATEAIVRAEVDLQISTAHRFPRSIKRFLERAESLVTATPEIAASCEYAKPTGGKMVNGPSARLAEMVAATYGNIRVGAQIISETNDQVTARGIAHDLETNVAQSTEATVSLLKRDGTRVGPEQVITARASAISKARRNATFLIVPVSICIPIITAARKCAAGDQQSLPLRRKALLDWLAVRKVLLPAVLEYLNVHGVEDIGLEQMADLIAVQNTAKEEGIQVDALFNRLRAQQQEERGGPIDQLAGAVTKKEQPKAEQKQQQPQQQATEWAPNAQEVGEAISRANATDEAQTAAIRAKHGLIGTNVGPLSFATRRALIAELDTLAGL